MLSAKIKELRKTHGLSQEALAEKLEISRQAISKWESGSSNPDIEYVIKMSNVFGVSTDYILKGNPENETVSQEQPTLLEKPARASKGSLILGIISSSISLIGLFTLKLLSSFFKGIEQTTAVEVTAGNYEDIATEVFSGFSGFLEYNNIKWTLTICIILLLIGIVCFIIYFVNKKKYTN